MLEFMDRLRQSAEAAQCGLRLLFQLRQCRFYGRFGIKDLELFLQLPDEFVK